LKKYIAIGDVHGCGKTLEKLLDQLKKYDDRIVVFIGDYIDRGPNSKLVLDLAMKLAEKQECIFLRGNHEQMMLDAFNDNYSVHWTRNGGLQTMISLGIKNVNNPMPEPYATFIENTKLYYDTEDYFFVHGGIPPLMTIAEVLESDYQESMMWERSHIHASIVNWEKPIVFGHTPMERVLIESKKIGIDTGCVFHNMPKMGDLSAILLPEKKVFKQPYCEF
jgi:serine/threonine protein phosphatase 1